MRVLAIVADTEVRDSLLVASFEQPRLARLPGHPETRVAETGAGTLVIVPAGTGALEVACTAAVATSRISPDVVLAVILLKDNSGIVFPESVIVDGATVETAGYLRDVATARLKGARVGAATSAGIAAGAAAAARAYGVGLLVLTIGGADAAALVRAAAPELFAADLRG